MLRERKRDAYIVDAMLKQRMWAQDQYDSSAETEPAVSPPPSPMREDSDDDKMDEVPLSPAEGIALRESLALYDYRVKKGPPESIADFILEMLVARTAFLHKRGQVSQPLLDSVVLAVNKLRLDPEFLPSMTPEQRDALLRADVTFRPGTFEKDHGLGKITTGAVATGVAYEDKQYGLYIANLPRMPYLDPNNDILPNHWIDAPNTLPGEYMIWYARFLYNSVDKRDVGAGLACAAGLAAGLPGMATAGAGAILRIVLGRGGGHSKTALVTSGSSGVAMVTSFGMARKMALKKLKKSFASQDEIVNALYDIITTRLRSVTRAKNMLASKVLDWNNSGAFNLYLSMVESAGFLGVGTHWITFLLMKKWFYSTHRLENFLSFNTKEDARHWVADLTLRINQLYSRATAIRYAGNLERCRRLLLDIERARRTINDSHAPPGQGRTLAKQAEDVSNFIKKMRKFERFYKRFARAQGAYPQHMRFEPQNRPEDYMINHLGEYVGDGWHLSDEDPNNGDNHNEYGPYDDRAVAIAGRAAQGGPPPPPPPPPFPGAPGDGGGGNDGGGGGPPPPDEGGDDDADNFLGLPDDDPDDDPPDDPPGPPGPPGPSEAQPERGFPGSQRPDETVEEWGARMEAWLDDEYPDEDKDEEEEAPLSGRRRRKSPVHKNQKKGNGRGKKKAPPLVVDASAAGRGGSVVDAIFARLKL